MNASEKNSFEEQWRSAFEDAELSPEPLVWANIETQLADAEADKYRRRFYAFKMRVAAGIAALIVVLSVWGLYNYQNASFKTATVATGADKRTDSENTTTISVENATRASSVPTDNGQASVQTDHSRVADAVVSSATKHPPIQPEHTALPSAGTEHRVARTGVGTLANTVKKNTQPVFVSPEEPTVRTTTHAKTMDVVSSSDQSVTASVLPRQAPGKQVITPAVGTEGSVQVTHAPEAMERQTAIAEGQPVGLGIESMALLTPKSIQTHTQIPVLKDMRAQMNEYFWNQVLKNETAQLAKNQRTGQPSRWQVGVGFTPGYFNPNFANSDPSAVQAPVDNFSFDASNNLRERPSSSLNSVPVVETNEITRRGWAYTTGLQAEYAFSKRISIQGGMQYNYNNSEVEVSPVLAAIAEPQLRQAFNGVLYNGLMSNAGSSYGLTSMTSKTSTYDAHVPRAEPQVVSNTYQYIRFPMQVMYKLLNRKVRASVGTGVSADLFLKNTIAQAASNGQAIEITSSNNATYRQTNFTGLLTVKVDYTLAKRYSIFIEPSYRQALTSFTTSGPLESYPSWWGIGTGFQYRF